MVRTAEVDRADGQPPIKQGGMNRRSDNFSLAITTALGTTGEFEFWDKAGGEIVVATGETVVTLTFHSQATADGEMVPAYTDAEPPVAITRTVAAPMAIPIPADLYGAYKIAITGDVAGTLEINRKA